MFESPRRSTREIAHRAVHEHHALQKTGELAQLLQCVLPGDLILEIGGDAGGTSWAFTKRGANVLTVDIVGGPFSSGRPMHVPSGGLFLRGDSHKTETKDKIVAWLGERRDFDLIMIDGDHTYEGVKQDYEMYHELISSSGRIAFHDICEHDPALNVGVRKFWRELTTDGRGVPFTELIERPTTWGGIGIYGLPPLDV